jgi:hypothetical protein
MEEVAVVVGAVEEESIGVRSLLLRVGRERGEMIGIGDDYEIMRL